MSRFANTCVLIVSCMSVAACWAPETFQATLSIDKTRHYRFNYDGTVVFGPALVQIKQAGRLTPREDAEIGKGVADLRKAPGVISAAYVGQGRFQMAYSEAGPVEPGRKVFLDLIQFDAAPGGGIRIRGATIPPEYRRELSDVGLRLDGTIRMTSDMPVVEHNAMSTPWFGGLLGSYKWRITSSQTAWPTALLR